MPNCAQVKSQYHSIINYQPIQFQKQKFLASITKDILFAILQAIIHIHESQQMNVSISVRYLISASTSIT